MLPKVATQLLHTTTRAVTSIQHQSYTLRNVLQNPSAGSSHWGNGPGPGGAKYNTGSRHNPFFGAGRAVTQANATISSNDGSFTQTDDQDDVTTRQSNASSTRRTRMRSNSFSVPAQGRTERAEKLGVLKTVQLHARSRHAFAPPLGASTPVEDPVPPSPRPILARRNSTSASPPTEVFDPSIPAPTPRSSRPSSPDTTAPESPQTVNPPNVDAEKRFSSHAARRLVTARDSGDAALAAQAVRDFRQTTVKPNVREFNYALEALQATRRAGEPLNLMLETYNDMLRHSLMPNFTTYTILIDTLTARDQEIHSAITALELRIKHSALTGFDQISSDDADRRRIEVLKTENNFPIAMSLFEAALAIGGNARFTAHIYSCLLRSCAIHGNIEAAIHVFAQQEKRENLLPSVWTFLEMIRVYTNAGQLAGAEQIFTEYRAAVKRGDIHVSWAREDADTSRGSIFVWNQMIETYFRFDRADKAIALVEQMLAAEPGLQGLIADPPPVATSTFTTVLTGFCQIGDVPTALLWFDRLLAQSEGSSDPYEPAGKAVKPDQVAWGVMLDSLAVKAMVDDINRLFVIRLQDNPRHIRNTERLVVFAANIAQVDSMTEEQFLWSMDFLQNHVLAVPTIKIGLRKELVADLTAAYLGRKMYEKALDLLSKHYSSWITATTTRDHELGSAHPVTDLQALQLNFTKKLYEVSQGDVPYTVTRTLARVAATVRVSQPPEYTPFFLQSYAMSRASDTLPADMSLRDWELLVMAASELESASNSDNPPQIVVPNYAFQGLESLIRDLAAYQVPFEQMNNNLIRHVILLLSQRLGMDGLVQLFKDTDFVDAINTPNRPQAALQQAVDDSASDANVTECTDSGYASSPTDTAHGLRIDSALTSTILNDLRSTHPSKAESSLTTAFAKFRIGFETGRIPTPTAFNTLIQALGRMGRAEELRYTYSAAQRLLEMLESNKEYQAVSWFMIENAMVIGLAHHGDVEGAHVHRQRLLQHGSAPDANAYGALIYNVKDTTDDASIALELFNESRTLQVAPNQYLYNNIISKLAKARKADYAMELFQQMKALGITPSSVTYGALIGACARVGDVHSAELLFSEMTEARNFKPRIPPYNTMMQVYTTTKPDRTRALHFYDEMRKANISPTAHTYKLLLDAYGAIEPVDIVGMVSTFRSLQADKSTPVQGIHIASLINAHGCVSKNLDAAVKVFNEMTIAPDALVFEAMINALVVHRRGDLIPEYVNKMHLAGVHMTAYIANSLIKCYSLLNNVEEARRVFETLEDPAVGVAAPNNHAPHAPSEGSIVDKSAPVYREPSTWEAMIRAELGSGNREGALALLERLRARKYPEAVFNRISGILVDHSQVEVPL